MTTRLSKIEERVKRARELYFGYDEVYFPAEFPSSANSDIHFLFEKLKIAIEALKVFTQEYSHSELCEISDAEPTETEGCTCAIKLSVKALQKIERDL